MQRPEVAVGVVIPAYREAETVPALLSQIRAHVPEAEVVVVDDSPDDDTVRAVEQLADARARIVHRSGKGGRGSAVVEGVRELLAHELDYVVEMDADLAHPPAQIPQLVAHAREHGLDVLIASRYVPGSRVENYGAHRKLLSRCSNLLERALLGIPVRDYTMGYRVYSRAAAGIVAEHCGKLGGGFIVLGEILVQTHYRGLAIGEVPTHFVHRVRDQGSVGPSEIFHSLQTLVRIAALKRDLVRQGPRHARSPPADEAP